MSHVFWDSLYLHMIHLYLFAQCPICIYIYIFIYIKYASLYQQNLQIYLQSIHACKINFWLQTLVQKKFSKEIEEGWS